MKARHGIALALWAALGLSGCSLWPSAPQSDSWAAQSEQQRRGLEQWTMQARVRTQERRASLRWKQQGEQFDLLLRGPFGLGGVRITGTPQQIEINDGENRQISQHPQRDIYQRTGLIVPVAALPYWLRGLAAPGKPFEIQRDPQGHVQGLQQDGWQVELADYQPVEGVAMAHEIRLSQAPWFLVVDINRWSWP